MNVLIDLDTPSPRTNSVWLPKMATNQIIKNTLEPVVLELYIYIYIYMTFLGVFSYVEYISDVICLQFKVNIKCWRSCKSQTWPLCGA